MGDWGFRLLMHYWLKCPTTKVREKSFISLNNNNLNHFIIKTIFRLLKNTKGEQKIPLAVDYTS